MKLTKIVVSIILIFCFALSVYANGELEYSQEEKGENNVNFDELNKAQISLFHEFENILLFGKAGKNITGIFFPHVSGNNFNINNLEQLYKYMRNPQLRERLLFLTHLILSQKVEKDISEIFDEEGLIIFIKCMTLCAEVDPEEKVFREALKYANNGTPDYNTLKIFGIRQPNANLKTDKKNYFPRLDNGKNSFSANKTKDIDKSEEGYSGKNTRSGSHKIISMDREYDNPAITSYTSLIQLHPFPNIKKYGKGTSTSQPDSESFEQSKHLNLSFNKNRQLLTENEIREYINGIHRNLRHPRTYKAPLSNTPSNVEEDGRNKLVNSMINYYVHNNKRPLSTHHLLRRSSIYTGSEESSKELIIDQI